MNELDGDSYAIRSLRVRIASDSDVVHENSLQRFDFLEQPDKRKFVSFSLPFLGHLETLTRPLWGRRVYTGLQNTGNTRRLDALVRKINILQKCDLI